MKTSISKPLNWQNFEDLCKKLFGEIWKCPDIKKNGRNGQNQKGVDIYGKPEGESDYFGIQCKGKDAYSNTKLTEREIDIEIKKAMDFRPSLKKFIFATTGNKDAGIEEHIRIKDQESRDNGNFEIVCYHWEDLADLIEDNPSTYKWYLTRSLTLQIFDDSDLHLKVVSSTTDDIDGFDENDGFIRKKQNDGIRILPSRKVYQRLNPDIDEWRREFSVCSPIIEGIESESILHKIYLALNYEKVFDLSIVASIEEEWWLSDLDYTIKLIKKPFISIELHLDGIGAYPSHSSQNIVVDFETGEQVKVSDFFDKESMERLASIIDAFVQADYKKVFILETNLDKMNNERDTDPNESNSPFSYLEEIYAGYKFTIDTFDNFFIDENGIAFIYDFGFPNVIKAIEPEGAYFFSFNYLRRFFKKGSKMEKFILENDY